MLGPDCLAWYRSGIIMGSPLKAGLTGRGILRFALIALKAVLAVHLAYIALTMVLILAYRFVNPPATVLMPYRAIGYGWKLQAPEPLALKKIPLYIRNMLVSVEDGKFWTHHGLDFEAFKRAREINARLGKPLYGGSTLTMQVARTLFLVPEKSYVRKYLEVIAALELELILPKERILELYFGYAEWGKGIFGIEAAARHWYRKGVAALSRDEAARLIALLSSPIRYTPSTLEKSGILRERYAYLVRKYVGGSEDGVAGAGASPSDLESQAAPLPSPEPGADLGEPGAAEGTVESDGADASSRGEAGGEAGATGLAAPLGVAGAARESDSAGGAPQEATQP